MHLAGLPITQELPGCNLLDESAVANRQSIFGEIYDHDAASIDDPAPSLRYRWIIENDWKLIQHIPLHKNPSPKTPDTTDSNSEPIAEQSTASPAAVNSNALAARLELYNLSQDPTEKNDLSSSEPAIVEKLLSQISNHWSDNN